MKIMNELKKNLNVLIVDDSQDWCATLRRELKQYLYFDLLPPLHTGKDAIAYIEVKRPDVILLDLIMPERDGFVVLDFIRKKMPRYQPYIYVLSAIGSDKIANLLYSYDVEHYSVKPIDPKVVAYNLHKMLSRDPVVGHLFEDRLPDLGAETQINSFLYDLGAPLYLTSTKCAGLTLQVCLADKDALSSITSLYKTVAARWKEKATPEAVERNIRSAVKNMQKQDLPFFHECFPYGQVKLTNADFLNRSVFLLQQRIDAYFKEKVFAGPADGIE